MKIFAQQNLDQALDLLHERLAFERAGVEFYDKILKVVQGSHEPGIRKMLPQLMSFRSQKTEHVAWLESQIDALGGSLSTETEHSRLASTEIAGIKEVVDGDYEVQHLFHALLQMELADNAAWQLLLELADRAGDDEARVQLKRRLHDESAHLLFVREAVVRFARVDVLGEGAAMSAPP